MKVLSPVSGCLVWGSGKGTENPQGFWPWSSEGFNYRTSTRLGIYRDGGHKQNRHQHPWERSSDSKRLSQTYLWMLRVSCRDVGQQWLTMGLGALATTVLIEWAQSLVWALLEISINHIIAPADSRTGFSQSKQLTGRKHNHTHQQTTGLVLLSTLATHQSKT